MRVLIACEFSQVVCKAFRERGHEAFSCDLLPTEGNPDWHIQDDVLEYLDLGWDLLIAHPPCTHIASSGARHFRKKIEDGRQQSAIDFFMRFISAPVERLAVENPVGIMSNVYRKPDQIVQPFMFGDTDRKTTCLWLKNLPKLVPTNIVEPDLVRAPSGRMWSRFYYDSYKLANADKSKFRSRTFKGMAEAMAEQWSD